VAGAVKANPGLYFGAFPASDWPLVIASWTAGDLLRLAPHAARVDLTLHHTGALSATVRDATVSAPPSAGPRPVADIVRAGMWHVELSRSTTVHVTADRVVPEPYPARTWSGLTVTVHSELDATLFGLPDGSWWRDGVNRFGRLMTNPRHRPPEGQHIRVTDEATGESAELPLADH
jgi:hypothetical protein